VDRLEKIEVRHRLKGAVRSHNSTMHTSKMSSIADKLLMMKHPLPLYACGQLHDDMLIENLQLKEVNVYNRSEARYDTCIGYQSGLGQAMNTTMHLYQFDAWYARYRTTEPTEPVHSATCGTTVLFVAEGKYANENLADLLERLTPEELATVGQQPPKAKDGSLERKEALATRIQDLEAEIAKCRAEINAMDEHALLEKAAVCTKRMAVARAYWLKKGTT